MIYYSIILPVFNEISVLQNCLESLKKQTVYDEMEIVVIDDGSTDGSEKFATLKQSHQGPGVARNNGASKAKGKVLLFVDADMEFEPDFVEKLTKSIVEGKTVGTFSKEEYLLNKNNLWARLWNKNLGRGEEKMLPDNYPDTAPVFRAILKEKFDEVGGFDPKLGYSDDWSLSQKLGVLAIAAPGAKYYHRNPDSLKEIWIQARWFGKNSFLTKNLIRKVYNLWRYFPLWAVFKLPDINFVRFKLVYNSAVFVSVLLSFFNEPKSK